jgi:hypothetical protein
MPETKVSMAEEQPTPALASSWFLRLPDRDQLKEASCIRRR